MAIQNIILCYDDITFEIKDRSGAYVGTLANPVAFPSEADKSKTDADITIQLLKQGLSADDIIKLKNQDLI